MAVKNLFDRETFQETTTRINNLTPDSERKWGKMTVSKMLAHLKVGFVVPLSDRPMKRMFLGRIIAPFFKSKMYDEKPWGRSMPTGGDFIIKDDREFYKERQELLELINQFHNKGAGGIGKYPHPFFGKFTPEQWGKMMWKHIDHHMQQFGV